MENVPCLRATETDDMTFSHDDPKMPAPIIKNAVSKSFIGLITACIITVFSLITLGVVVRVTGSGLGCPDWPLCHGSVIPPLEFHTLIEYSHRLTASLTMAMLILVTGVAWWRYRHHSHVVALLTLVLILVCVEAVLGGITVLTELSPNIVTVHLLIAQSIFAFLIIALIRSSQTKTPDILTNNPAVAWWTGIAALTTLAVIVWGSYVVGLGAGRLCPSWPLCDAGLLPSSNLAWLHMTHRVFAVLGAILALRAIAVARHIPQQGLIKNSTFQFIAAFVVISQILVGGLIPWTGFSSFTITLHVSLATAQLGILVAFMASAWIPKAPTSEYFGSLCALLSGYLALMKPKIIMLLLVTALGGLFLASEGVPPLSVTLLVLIGGAIGAGGANALNHYFDQDIDKRMHRTKGRPIPNRTISPRNAIAFGIILNILAFTMLAIFVNLLSAMLTIAASIFYILVYTRWLKRSTTQNIVIGGAAGAVPPMVGWAAITGEIALPSLYLFAIIFFWTPPHFWALSLLLHKDYERANVPMLPVVAGTKATAQSIMLHSLILVSITIMFYTIGILGWVYILGASILGTYFLFLAWRLLREQSTRTARALYLYSLAYLALLFVLIMIDSVVNL